MSCPERIALNRAAVPPHFKPRSFGCMSEEYRLQPKKDCHVCDACLQKREVQEHEATPLLPPPDGHCVAKKTRCHDNLLLALLSVVLLCSLLVVVAIYVEEDRSGNIIREFEFVASGDWRPAAEVRLLALPASCRHRTLRAGGKARMEIDGPPQYDFYQAEDGKVYEGRGWGAARAPDGTATIALIGSPPPPQLAAFLRFSAANGALRPCYRVKAQEESLRAFAAALGDPSCP